MRGRAAALLLASGSLLLLGWLLSAGPRAGARPLTSLERELILPALAGSLRPALASHREPAARILGELAGGGEVSLVPGSAPVAVLGPETLPLPPAFLADLDRMAEGLARLRAIPVPGPDPLAGGLEALQKEIWSSMVAAQVLVKGQPWRVSRLAIAGEGGATVLPEPVVDAVRAMDATRGSYAGAVALYERGTELWRKADPHHLFDNLAKRTKARRYDDAKILQHLGITIDALIPNLADTVAADVAGVLEAAVAGTLPARPAACLAVRDATPVNLLIDHEDRRFAAAVAPLVIVVRDDAGRAQVTVLWAEGGDVQGKTVERLVP